MAFDHLTGSLRKAEKEVEGQLARIRAAISSLVGSVVSTGRKRGRPAGSKNKKAIIIIGGKPKRKRRKLSAKARAAMSAAQKARWARQRGGEKKQ